ncbi:hypothetical protein [Emticicia sp. TH156]|uniref:hypothetical protein n=1 Tax=Emticicia sp. TH156 TaxID=2067454 RepID=UPI000C760C7F|nr:hypothetical protein [Emticicia sp. TH156]
MNLLCKICLPALFVTQSFAQDLSLLSKKWILLNSRIENKDIYLASYSPSKLKADSFVIHFLQDGKIDYDYETNHSSKHSRRTEFLDLDTEVSGWQYEASENIMTLTLKGGYTSMDEFNFKRRYKMEKIAGGYVLKNTTDIVNELAVVSVPTQPEESKLLVKESNVEPAAMATSVVAGHLPESVKETVHEKARNVKDHKAISKAVLMPTRRWILVGNKITKNVIRLTSFDASKFRINTLVLNFEADGKISYEYEMDPELEACAGINFLDIDTDESGWAFNETTNVLTLTIKGGVSSLDDFKFKRDYRIEQTGNEFVLHKLTEHYFIDFKKPHRSR